MTRSNVVAQAPYPVPISTGRHLVPGEIAKNVEVTPEVESLIKLGMLREIADITEPIPLTPKLTTKTPKAESASEDQDVS